VPVTGPLEALHVVVFPLTFHVKVPAGAGRRVEPEMRAVKVRV